MDNPRLILYMALGLVMLLIWQAWQTDHTPPARSAKPAAGDTQRPGARSHGADEPQGRVPGAAGTADVPASAAAESSPAESSPAQPVSKANNKAAASPRIHVQTDVLDVEIATRGGDIRRLALPTYPEAADRPDEPVVLMHEQPTVYVAQSGLIHDQTAGQRDISQLAPSHHALYRSQKTEYRLKPGQDILKVELQWDGPAGVSVAKTYTFHRGEFLVDLDHQVVNRGDAPWVGRQYLQLRHGPAAEQGGSSFMMHRTYKGTAYYDGKYEKLSFDDMAENPLNARIQGGWVAILQHYFVSAWVPPPDAKGDLYSNVIHNGPTPEYIIGLRSGPKQAAPGETVDFHSQLFSGPELQRKLAAVTEGLELTTDYGIFTVISKPLFKLLSWIHGLVGNWGWAIILLTILIKLAFYKLSEMSYRSMAKMRTVQPRMKALRERYGEDKQKMNQALMDLYKQEKINPLGGCLPILVQIPVFIALYWVLIESVELRHAGFIFWLDDLSSRDPYFVLPVLYGLTMLVQQKLNPTPPDPLQAKIMTIMPLGLSVLFAFFPSGLVLYYLVNNVLSIAQQWVITRRIEQQATA